MARRYSRDNRGRFTGGGSGATARGGRLRTAGGNKRKTQTMSAKGVGGAGVMKGKAKRDPGARSKLAKTSPTARSAVPKVQLNKANLQERLTRSPASVRNFSPSWSEKRRTAVRSLAVKKDSFSNFIQSSAIAKGAKLKASPQQKDEAWAKAFKARPVYSTRQKVRPQFGNAARAAAGIPQVR